MTTEDPGRIPCICVCLHTRSPCPTAAPTSCCFWPCALSRNWLLRGFLHLYVFCPLFHDSEASVLPFNLSHPNVATFYKTLPLLTFYLLAILHVFLKTDDFKARVSIDFVVS